jgi:alpha-beta hydrolase superfamily lysophospholipase
MLGHSMGSLAARCYLKKWGDTIDALILSGSPKKNSAVGVARIVAKLWKKLFGSRKKSKLITALVFGPYVAAYKKEKSAFAWICKDPETVRLYDEDEKCGFGFTVDGFSVLFDLLYRTYENKKFPYEKVNKELPIMFISGECDPCIDGAENFRKAMESVKSGGYVKVQGKLYDTLRHEIFNEKEKITVFQDVLNFLEDNL